MNTLDFIAAQSAAIEAEDFQSTIIEAMARALLREPSPPCLLRAPTGAGKTFMISRVLEEVSAKRPTLWLWFVPFVNLVQQTEDALAANCAGLVPVMLSRGRNQDTRAGMVLLSTAQGVARIRDRNAGYDADGDDDKRTLAEFVARARSQGLALGLIVDEAHIGLDKATEFGKFAHWLKADFLIMATATPKDERLNEFLKEAGMSAFESFAASRDEVVAARLNKRYIEAVVYDLRQSVQTVADLKRTVLRQGWKRSQRLKRRLQEAGVNLTPLLLVQVANGDNTVEEAERDLMELCKVHPAAIGKHSADAPDPVLMAAIANDSSKEVLIFKQSAGTGFDAPRAFVLASTKPVNDVDFAMQFIGRVMRVARPIREAFPKPAAIPPDLDTAYVYLANAEAQRGFEAAVQASSAMRSQLEGQTEKLAVRQMASGAIVLTNRETAQMPLAYDLPLPEANPTPEPTLAAHPTPGPQLSLFEDLADTGKLYATDDDGLDEMLPPKTSEIPKAAYGANPPRSKADWLDWLKNKGIRAYPLRADARNLPLALKRERRPELDDMGKVSETVAARLAVPDDLKKSAVRAALNRLKEKDLAKVGQILLLEERDWLADRRLALANGELRIANYDGTAKLNGEELEFAKALDRADFVAWWHRNPDRKPYAVRLVRSEHQNYFHPDFVVCLSHYQDDEPLPRLVETKENVKDAARKARRVPKGYGKVLFLTKDQNRLRVVNDNGSLGLAVDWDDLAPIREWLRESKPTT